MLFESKNLLNELYSRLPELEWKISRLGVAFSPHSLPKGLFRYELEPSGTSFIAQIKCDIDALVEQNNERSAMYLATRIRQKINVLVALCQIHHRKNKTEDKIHFGIKMLSTRQQWIHDVEEDIQILKQQRKSLLKALDQKHRNEDAEAILNLKVELGALERRLTLAKETLSRSIA